MATFDRPFARLQLEICRYTYAAGFGDAQNKPDQVEASNWITTTAKFGGKLTILRGSKTSVACVASSPERNIVAYMGTKTQFDNARNTAASVEDWFNNLEAEPVPFQLTTEQLGQGHPQNIDKNNLGGKVHKGFLEELAAVQGNVVALLMANGGRERPVHVTGHSQGGAEAALATRALLAGGFNVAST